jgi:hypothetical protein
MLDVTSSVDRSRDVAAFLDTQPVGATAQDIMRAVAARWPDLSKDEYLRALDIAIAAFSGAPDPATGLAA